VKDEGTGILPENLEKIFTAVHSTKGANRGYGLWRSRNIIEEKLGGKIKVESKIGVGSKFIISLPKSKRV
jgi:two-component system NtrC family sensor kinase